MDGKDITMFAMPNLILIPTSFERQRLVPALQRHASLLPDDTAWRIELCGFGLVAAAARTAQLIARCRPTRVVLLGIAGSYGDTLSVGDAYCFDRVRCGGIGVGSLDQSSYQSAQSLGWSQLQLDDADGSLTIGDEIELCHDDDEDYGRVLLSVAGAAADEADSARRSALYPDVVAEEMEGYAVAMACRLYGVPLTIIRGISNKAGQRDQRRWDVDGALEATGKRFGKWSAKFASTR